MALVQCPECRNDVSNKAETCPRCGHPIRRKKEKNAWVRARRIFAIVNLLYGWMLMFLSSNVEGELEKDFSMAGIAAWFLIWCGILQLIGIRRRGFTIAVIVFYSIGIMFNLMASLVSIVNFGVVFLMTIFLIFTAISLPDPRSFYQR